MEKVKFTFKSGETIFMDSKYIKKFSINTDFREELEIYISIVGDKQIKILDENRNIDNIEVFEKDNVCNYTIYPLWNEDNDEINYYQVTDSISYIDNSIEISISKDNYIYKQIDNLVEERDIIDKRIGELYEEISCIKQNKLRQKVNFKRKFKEDIMVELVSAENINKTKEFLMNRNVEKVKIIEKNRNFIGELIPYAIVMDKCLIYKGSDPLADFYVTALDLGDEVKCLYCDGSEVTREEYKELFDLIGTRYGVGNDITTFNLPNLVESIN